jgi:hypothetical protein
LGISKDGDNEQDLLLIFSVIGNIGETALSEAMEREKTSPANPKNP